ncbi:MAG: CoA transferase [bacterium]|nr:CoA transferase [bacterium]MDE0287291.1 CoA transferase [bacterium]MDE0438953.1 CoA transferase [bacterium]
MAEQRPLSDVRVIDMATIIAGPGAARHLADFGADVIKVEAPGGDATRRLGWTEPGSDDSYFWKLAGRGKRSIVLDLKHPKGREAMLRLVDTADVLVENMRPGKLEGLGLAPDLLHERNRRLVILRVTGFGQSGPYASRPAFATLIEAMSGLSAISGLPGDQPLLPPIPLTDEVTGMLGAFSVMVALRHAENTGEGQVIDLSLLESTLQLMGPLPSAFAHLGYLQPRLGAGLPWTVPRGTYQCADGAWVALSCSNDAVAKRVLELVGAAGDPRFATFQARFNNRDELEALMVDWIAVRASGEVMRRFREVDAAIAPVCTMAEVFADEQVQHRNAIVEVDGVQMQGIAPRLSASPGEVRFAGRSLGADTIEVLSELGVDVPPEATGN